jgi:hypothetical protein
MSKKKNSEKRKVEVQKQIDIKPTLVSTNYYRWILPVGIFSVACGLLFNFIAQFPGYLPVDDSYICLSFARNIVERGEFFSYNPGELSTGITSPLYAVLLAGVYCLVGDWHTAVLGLGVFSFIVAILGMMRLAYQIAGYWAVVGITCFFGFSGHMGFFALFGMEPMLHIAFSVFAFSLFLSGRYFFSGCLVGLGMLCRPESVFLAVVLGLFFAIQIVIGLTKKKPILPEVKNGILFSLGFVLCVLPWILRCKQISDSFLPSTVAMKTYTDTPFARTWAFWVDSVRMYFPDSWHNKIMDSVMRPTVYMKLRTVIPLTMVAMVSLFGLKKSWKATLFFLYIPLHLMVAGFRNADCADNERYLALDYAITYLYLSVLFALCIKSQVQNAFFRMVGKICATSALVALSLLLIMDYQWHIKIFQVKAQYFHRLDYQIGEWLAKNTPSSTRIALYQAGGIKFFGNRYIIDGGGVSEHTIWKYLKSGTFAQSLIDRKADYVASFGDEWLMAEGVHLRDSRFFKPVPLNCRGLYKIVNRDALAMYLKEQHLQRKLTPPTVPEK